MSSTRPAWLWLGQLGLVLLGVHFAADRLDDLLLLVFAPLPIPWPHAQMPALVAAWTAVAVELTVALRATWILISSAGGPEPTREDWWEKRSVESFVRPLFWATAAACGAWAVGGAIEDQLMLWSPTGATITGASIAVLVGWRLGWTGWLKTTGGLFKPKRRTAGLVWSPILLAVVAIDLAYTLNLFGWVP